MIAGSCPCGTARFEVEAVRDMARCRCSSCRKHHGAAFATMARVREEAFRWTAGEDTVRRHESSPGFHRSFCGICSSSLPGRAPAGGRFVPAGLFANDPGRRPIAPVFAASKAPWSSIADGLPRFDGGPPNRGLPEIGRIPARRAEGLGGRCVRGAVVRDVRAVFHHVRSRHRSRCRRARAAAHATGGFTSADGARVRRGEDIAVEWQLPEARLFAVCFCRICGSGVPRRDPERGCAVMPMGTLDSGPQRGVDRHILTAFMAPRHAISDDIPQFVEASPD